MGEISVEVKLQHHILFFPRDKCVFFFGGKRGWSGEDKRTPDSTAGSGICNRQGNTSPKWESKCCSCIICTNTCVEPYLTVRTMQQFFWQQQNLLPYQGLLFGGNLFCCVTSAMEILVSFSRTIQQGMGAKYAILVQNERRPFAELEEWSKGEAC